MFGKKKGEEGKSKAARSWKSQAEQTLPALGVRADRVPAETKAIIFELQQEYINRYNILMRNRQIFQNIFDSIATELDGIGVTQEQLAAFCKSIRKSQGQEDTTQAE